MFVCGYCRENALDKMGNCMGRSRGPCELCCKVDLCYGVINYKCKSNWKYFIRKDDEKMKTIELACLLRDALSEMEADDCDTPGNLRILWNALNDKINSEKIKNNELKIGDRVAYYCYDRYVGYISGFAENCPLVKVTLSDNMQVWVHRKQCRKLKVKSNA